MALAGCSGGAHAADNRTAPVAGAAIAEASSGATPFGVAQPLASPSTAPSAVSSVAPATASVAPAAASVAPAAASVAPAATLAATGASPAAALASASAGSAPQILSVHTSPAVVHDGDTLLWSVHTTPDVVDVVAHVTVYAFRLQKRGTGQYVLTFTIPHGVPGFFHGNYTLDLVARSATGAEATTKVPVAFQ